MRMNFDVDCKNNGIEYNDDDDDDVDYNGLKSPTTQILKLGKILRLKLEPKIHPIDDSHIHTHCITK